MAELSEKQIKGVLKSTIDAHLNRVVAWLEKTLPDRDSAYLFRYIKIRRLSVHILFRVSFYNDSKLEIREPTIGLPGGPIDPSKIRSWYAHPEDKDRKARNIKAVV